MIHTRVNHAAGIVTDEATLEKVVVVSGGFGFDASTILNSTEILIGDVWSLGKKE